MARIGFATLCAAAAALTLIAAQPVLADEATNGSTSTASPRTASG